MGGLCSAYEGEKRFWWGNLTERENLADPGVMGV